MDNVKFIDKGMITPVVKRPRNYWQELVKSIPNDKMAEINCKTKIEAQHCRTSVLVGAHRIGVEIATSTKDNVLYVWKI